MQTQSSHTGHGSFIQARAAARMLPREEYVEIEMVYADVPDYDPDVAAAFARLGAEYDSLCDALFRNDPELGVEVDPPLAPAG